MFSRSLPLRKFRGYKDGQKNTEQGRWSCNERRDGIIPPRWTETLDTERTPTSGHVSLMRQTNETCDIEGRTNLARGFKKWYVYSLGGTRHDNRELFKWNSWNEPAAFASTEIQVLGERPRSHTLYIRLFLCRQFIPALYLPDNLTPIYGFVRVKSWTSRKYTIADAEIQWFAKNQLYLLITLINKAFLTRIKTLIFC